MAKALSFYYPGKVVEKLEIHELENDKSVINMIVQHTQEVVKGFKEDFEKRIVMFSRKAEEADSQIEKGDYVIFSRCKRNPREFTTEAGNEIKTVDILAEQFKVVPKKDFDTIAKALAKNVPDMNSLEFNTDDATFLANKAALVTQKAAGTEEAADI